MQEQERLLRLKGLYADRNLMTREDIDDITYRILEQ